MTRTSMISLVLFVLAVLISGIYVKLVVGNPSQSIYDTSFIETDPLAILIRRLTTPVVFCLVALIIFSGNSGELGKWNAFFIMLPIVAVLLLSLLVKLQDYSQILRSGNFILYSSAAVLLSTSRAVSRMMQISLARLAVGSIVVVVVLYISGSQFIYFSDGFNSRFSGLFFHKGQMSNFLAIGLICFICSAWRSERPILFWVIVACFLSFIAYGATVSTYGGLVAALVARKFFKATLYLAFVFALTLPLTNSFLGTAFEIIGRDATLTGRTVLWDFALSKASEAPLFGHGFVSIASSSEWLILLQVFSNDSFLIPHSHNLWLEIFYKFGFIGIAVFSFVLVFLPSQIGPSKDPAILTARSICAFYTIKSGLVVPFLDTGFDTFVYMFSVALLFQARSGGRLNLRISRSRHRMVS